jgi:hypothetical protein
LKKKAEKKDDKKGKESLIGKYWYDPIFGPIWP